MTLRRNKDAYSELEMHFHVSGLQLSITVAQKRFFQQNKIVIETKRRIQDAKDFISMFLRCWLGWSLPSILVLQYLATRWAIKIRYIDSKYEEEKTL